MIDKIVLKNCKRRMKNLSFAWTDYKKTYVMVSYTWILLGLKVFKVADNIRYVIENTMKDLKVELTEVSFKEKYISSLSPILLTITLIPLSVLLRDMKAEYMLGKFRGKINHLLVRDDLKLYGKAVQKLVSIANNKNFQ